MNNRNFFFAAATRASVRGGRESVVQGGRGYHLRLMHFLVGLHHRQSSRAAYFPARLS
jgi:hypothetical protein